MARRVLIDLQAAEDLRQARSWLNQKGSGREGRARWKSLRTASARLRRHPYFGAASLDLPNRRQLVVSEYRIIYRVHPDTGESATAGDILILAVFGPGQP